MFHFVFELTVGEEDVNYRNHASFDKYLVFFHRARIAYLAALGYHFDGETINPGLIAAEAHCTYKKEIRLGDVITVKCRIREIKQKSMVMAFLIVLNDQVCAEGSGTFLYFDYQTRKVTAFMDRFIKDVQSFEGMTA